MINAGTTQIEDAILPMVQHSVRLAAFEGPLDLLLHLIRKHEIDIYDIPIETITRQYLEYIYSCKTMDLELTGEFFVMAATLMLIKSRMLLPRQDITAESEEEESYESDPRWELVQQLLEYKKIKESAQILESLISNHCDLLPRLVKENLASFNRPVKNSDRIELWTTFNQILHRLSERMYTGEINDDNYTVADRMSFIMEKIKTQTSFVFTSLFPEGKISINLLVTSFLAILELSRLKILFIEQTENFGDVLCSKKKGPLEAIV